MLRLRDCKGRPRLLRVVSQNRLERPRKQSLPLLKEQVVVGSLVDLTTGENDEPTARPDPLLQGFHPRLIELVDIAQVDRLVSIERSRSEVRIADNLSRDAG